MYLLENKFKLKCEQKINVFFGMQKDNRVHVRNLKFNPEIPLTLDLVLGSVVMRHRQIVKGLFNSCNHENTVKAAIPMQIEGLFEIDTTEHFSCHIDHVHKNLQGETLVFFLNLDGVWMMNGVCDELSIGRPIPVTKVFESYYRSHYPQEVVNFAFKDPKEPKRVYQVEEYDGVEDFLFEPLFQESDIIDHVVVAIKPQKSMVPEEQEETEKKIA